MKFAKSFVSLAIVLVSISFNCFAYTDMEDHWAKETVEYLSVHEMINGYEDNSFKPNNYVSRAEIIKLVVSKYMEDNISSNPNEHWAMPYVRFAEENNIIMKNSYTSVNLDTPATRKEICYMLIQACRYIAYKPVLDNTDMQLDFEDFNEENMYEINEGGIDYATAMKLCYAMGIIKGYPVFEKYEYTKPDGTIGIATNRVPKRVKPNENVTRAEASTMVARTYFAQYREYTIVKRNKEQQPSNASEFMETYTYMPKSFYEAGSDSFFKYDMDIKNPAEFFSFYSNDTVKGKVRVEGSFDTLFNISYKMTDKQWSLWKKEMLQFSYVKECISDGSLDLDEYVQFIKDNKIVIKGGCIVDPSTSGYAKLHSFGYNNTLLSMKGISKLYIENPNNIDDISINRFLGYPHTQKINKSFEQGYIASALGGIDVTAQNYIMFMNLSTAFYFLY